MIILFVRGFSGAGKDTFGKCCVDHFGFQRVAFADGLKRYVSKHYDVDEEILHSQEGKQQICGLSGTTWREILLREGRTLRGTDPDIFAKEAASYIKKSGSDKIVITDWRYPNEYVVICREFPNANIITILIQRLDQVESPVNDVTEYLLKDHPIDYTLFNDGKSDLLPKVKELFTGYKFFKTIHKK